MRAVLLEILKFNRKLKEEGKVPITTVGFHFSNWTFKDYSVEESARRMLFGYVYFHCPVVDPSKLSDDGFLLNTEKSLRVYQMTEEEKERDFLDKLYDGIIGASLNLR